ncbi:pregnancy-specific glycoprotein 22-like [Garra rufa]|uniref:pregnancy-specific glycoprotein 22-like n=1 Tax=Garra rufa TaxID=137080 RepID=UPI003CCE73C6
MKVFVLLILCILFVPGADDNDNKNDEVSVSVTEEDSVTLNTGVETNQQDRMTWYFNNTRIAQIRGNQSKICTDEHCTERFRGRLKLDSQTGDLTITNTRTTDTGVFQLNTISRRINQRIFNVTVLAVSGAETDETKTKSVMEGESVTLDPGLVRNLNDLMAWYFNDNLIAEITGDHSKICKDEQCEERFRDRLELNHRTGSLTITNVNSTDAGVYKLQNNSRIHPHHSIISIKRFSITVTGLGGVETDGVSVSLMEGDSVTLHTDVKTNQDRIRWYFNDIRIAQITGEQRKICTDEQCDGRFRDRLKLDHQTGSLTIMNTRTRDTGDYKLQIIRKQIIQKIFNVAVGGVPADERDEVKRMSVKEGESVTLDPGEIKNPNDIMTWYFNDIPIAEITGDESKICTDDQCDEKFRDRLELDHQTGSLTITNTRTTDSGDYKLQVVHIIRRRHSISITNFKRFSITIIGPSLGLIVGISVAATAAIIFFLLVILALISRRRKSGIL